MTWAKNDRHAAIVIIPTDQNDWKTHPRFTQKAEFGGVELHYLTLSGHSSNSTNPTDGWLTKADNWDTDKPFMSTNRVDQELTISGGYENTLIQALLDLDDAFDNNQLDYDLWPLDGSSSYNSNSYARGLLEAAGFSAQAKDEELYPGWNNPVPPQHFEAD